MPFLGKVRRSRAAQKVKGRVRRYTRDDALHARVADLERAVAHLGQLDETVRTLVARVDTLAVPAALATASDLEATRAQLADLEIALAQVRYLVRREGKTLPIPPKHLQVRVVGSYQPGFLESGFSICRDLERILSPAGRKLSDFTRLLDWGCGSGRVIRAMRALLPSAELFGTDIDPEAIAWLQENCAPIADFRVAPHRPPMSYPNSSFDFVLGLSVFTHLPEDMQFEWLSELSRIAAPGALLVLTTSGEKNYRNLDDATRRILDEKGFFYADLVNYGRSISLPDFYQNTFHSLDYIRREWSKYFEIVDLQPAGMQAHQDAILLRKPA